MTAGSVRATIVGAVAALFALGAASAAGAQTSTQTLSPPTLDFGTVTAGEVGGSLEATFSSNAPVTVDRVGVTGEFDLVGGTCGTGVVVSPGAAGCTVQVRFVPTGPGDKRGTVTVAYGGQGLARTSSLSGTAVSPTTTTPPAPSTTVPRGTTTPTRATTTTMAVEETTTSSSVAETTTTTTTTTTVATGGRRATLDATTVDGRRTGPPGIGVTMAGSGFPAGTQRVLGGRQLAAPWAQPAPGCGTVYFFLGDQRLGSAQPSPAGDVGKSGLSVPADVGPGHHRITASCRTSGQPVLASTGFDVTDAEVHRSVLATSLPQADQVDFGLGALLASALAVVGLIVLIAFPAELFNTTLEANYDEVRGWFRLKPRALGGGRHHAALLTTFLLLSGPLWFAMQPSSGFDAATALGALGLSVATAVVVLASGLPESLHVRRRYGERARAIALPGALVIAVACVVLSRAVNFQPGYFYGLVGGLALSRTLPRDQSGRLAATAVAGMLALSVVTWLALLPVSAAAAESGRTLGIILVENILAGIFWAALDSLVIAMLPLRLLDGARVIAWNRAAWAALYAVTLLAFVHILLRPSTGYVSNTSVSPPNVVVGLFVAFALFSFAFWGYFRYRPVGGEPPGNNGRLSRRSAPG